MNEKFYFAFRHYSCYSIFSGPVWYEKEYNIGRWSKYIVDLKKASLFKYTKEQTEDMCLAAVKRYGRNIMFVKNKTHKICLEAVKIDGDALQFIKEQTTEICIAAVTQYCYALQHVKEQTEEICWAAIKNGYVSIKYVKQPTIEMCEYVFLRDPVYGVGYIKDPTLEQCVKALKGNRYFAETIIKYRPELFYQILKDKKLMGQLGILTGDASYFKKIKALVASKRQDIISKLN